MQIVEFSMTPMPKLVYLWKFLLGLIWAIVLVVISNFNANQGINFLIATLVVVIVSNFVIILLTILIGLLNKSFNAFVSNLMDVGNFLLLSIAAGIILFVLVNSFTSLASSLIIASILTCIIFSSATIYLAVKLLNGNYFKIGAANMYSILVQAALMYGTLFILGY